MTKLEQLCEEHGITVSCKPGRPHADWPDSYPYKVTLTHKRRTLTVNFCCVSGWTREPNAADVLSSLLLDARCGEMDFSEFCDEFGYDRDSRKIGALHLACVSMSPRVRRFLGNELFEIFAAAEH
jgi:hypothetical protein